MDLRTWAVRQHLVPALGARRLRELRADDVARFLQDKAAAGYSRASFDKMRGVLVQALRHAERQRTTCWRPPAGTLSKRRSWSV